MMGIFVAQAAARTRSCRTRPSPPNSENPPATVTTPPAPHSAASSTRSVVRSAPIMERTASTGVPMDCRLGYVVWPKTDAWRGWTKNTSASLSSVPSELAA